MSTNVQNLFGIDDGKSPRQNSFETLYVSNGIDFDPIFQEAHQLTLDDPTPNIYRGRGFMAYHMNWNLVGLFKQNYPDRMGCDKHDRPYYMLNENTRVYFKKTE